LAAAHTPWDLDQDVLRRFDKGVYIPLPEPPARYVILKSKLKDTPHALTDDEISYVANITEGYSGADLNVLAREASMLAIRKVQQSQWFKTNPEGKWVIAKPNEHGAQQKTLMELDPDNVAAPCVTFEDFLESKEKVQPSVSQKDLSQYERWTLQS
jgi:vacuolar protein-sorting-associated protein 4